MTINKIRLLILFIIMFSFITGCNKEKEIVNISINEYDVKQDIDEFNISDLSLKLSYDDDTYDNINVTRDMISTDDLAKLSQMGKHSIVITYNQMKVEASINLTNYYEVKYVIDNNVIDTQNVEYGMDSVLPNTEKEGYTFLGWDKDGKNITEDTVINGSYNINDYKVTFNIYDYETYVKEAMYQYNYEISDVDLELLEDEYFITIDKDLYYETNKNNKVTNDLIINIYTSDYNATEASDKENLNGYNDISYDLCIAYGDSLTTSDIINAEIINENELIEFNEYFYNYINNKEKDKFNIYLVTENGNDYVIIQSKVNKNSVKMYESNLNYSLVLLRESFKTMHNITLDDEFLNNCKSNDRFSKGIELSFNDGVISYLVKFDNLIYEIDGVNKLYKVFNDDDIISRLYGNYPNSMKYFPPYFNMENRINRLKATGKLYKFKTTNENYYYINGYTSKKFNYVFEDIRWYVGTQDEFNKIGDKRIISSFKVIEGILVKDVYENIEINKNAKFYINRYSYGMNSNYNYEEFFYFEDFFGNNEYYIDKDNYLTIITSLSLRVRFECVYINGLENLLFKSSWINNEGEVMDDYLTDELGNLYDYLIKTMTIDYCKDEHYWYSAIPINSIIDYINDVKE